MSKEVFVWKAYGDINVYSKEYPGLIDKVIECLIQEGSEIPENPTWKQVIKLVEDQTMYGADLFEYGTGFHKLLEE